MSDTAAQPSTSGVTHPALTEQDKSLRWAYIKNLAPRVHHCSSDYYTDSSDYSSDNVNKHVLYFLRDKQEVMKITNIKNFSGSQENCTEDLIIYKINISNIVKGLEE